MSPDLGAGEKGGLMKGKTMNLLPHLKPPLFPHRAQRETGSHQDAEAEGQEAEGGPAAGGG